MNNNNNVYFPLKSSQELLRDFDPSHSEVVRLLQEVRQLQATEPPPTKESSISKHLLSNGLSVGEFCLWYIATNRVIGTAKCRKKKEAVVENGEK